MRDQPQQGIGEGVHGGHPVYEGLEQDGQYVFDGEYCVINNGGEYDHVDVADCDEADVQGEL